METSVNNKCKAFTSLEQSKKLAKILPLESADAVYPWRELMKDYDSIYVPEEMLMSDIGEDDIYAWSLAALLSVLPKYELYNFGDTIQLDVNREALATEGDETLLDLVVNMIIHLYEIKVL